MIGGALEKRWKEFRRYMSTRDCALRSFLRYERLRSGGKYGLRPPASLDSIYTTVVKHLQWASTLGSIAFTAFFCLQALTCQPATSDALFPENGRRSAEVKISGLRA